MSNGDGAEPDLGERDGMPVSLRLHDPDLHETTCHRYVAFGGESNECCVWEYDAPGDVGDAVAARRRVSFCKRATVAGRQMRAAERR